MSGDVEPAGGDLRPGDGATPHAFVSDLVAPQLDDADHHHLARVRRLRPGDLLTVSDGLGAWRVCRFGEELEPLGEIGHEPPPAWPATVAFALTKGHKPDVVVQKLTEIGVDRIEPFVAARSVVRWDDDECTRRVARWERIVREAAMQSGRCRLPTVAAVASFADIATDAAGDATVVMAVRGAPPVDPAHRRVLVGPEGGWDPGELRRGLGTVGLAAPVLRAETAAIVAGVLLVHHRSR